MSTRQQGKAIRRLRLLVPTFECVPGCTDCCGPVPFSEWEWSQVPEKKTTPSIACVYRGASGCSIYDDRPMLCRLFGATEDQRMVCPHGKAPAKPLTVPETDRLMDEYMRWVGDDIHGPMVKPVGT